MKEKILLICGVHPNEVCAAKIAEQVFHELQSRECNAELYNVPRRFTLLGVLDRDEGADTEYCIDDMGNIDNDLESLIGDEVLNEKYPGSTAVEFHNYSDSVVNQRLHVEAGLSVERFRIGDISPGERGSYEIGFWRNRPGGGIIGKYCIELPATYVDVSGACRSRRFRNLARLEREGYAFPEERKDVMIREYLVQEASIEESTRRKYLSSKIVAKVLEWVLSIAGEGKG